jgi:hypothetical protein
MATGGDDCCPCKDNNRVKEDRKEGEQMTVTDVDGGRKVRLFLTRYVIQLLLDMLSLPSFLSLHY